MNEPQTVIHQTLNGKYRMVIEQAASTKGVLGYKIEANGDDMGVVVADIQRLQKEAAKLCQPPETTWAPITVKVEAKKSEPVTA